MSVEKLSSPLAQFSIGLALRAKTNMASGTSFQRKTRAKVSHIRGVKPSLQNNQLLVSTGVPSFDLVIGRIRT